MNNIKIDEISNRIHFLKEIIQKKEVALKKAPNGLLNVARAGERVQFYYKKASNERSRKYLKKSQKRLIKLLCQKDYDERVIEAAQRELKCLERLHKCYEQGECEGVYQKLIPERRQFVKPVELSEEEFVEQWLAQPYESKGFRDGSPEYYTDNGERVRSKSEILIANALKKHQIPYRYEAPLYLDGIGTIYPDFTVLNVRTRTTYFWEHLGMMDDEEYMDGALRRIEAYAKNRIFPGLRLILSHETSTRPIQSRNIERMIIEYLK